MMLRRLFWFGAMALRFAVMVLLGVTGIAMMLDAQKARVPALPEVGVGECGNQYTVAGPLKDPAPLTIIGDNPEMVAEMSGAALPNYWAERLPFRARFRRVNEGHDPLAFTARNHTNLVRTSHDPCEPECLLYGYAGFTGDMIPGDPPWTRKVTCANQLCVWGFHTLDNRCEESRTFRAAARAGLVYWGDERASGEHWNDRAWWRGQYRIRHFGEGPGHTLLRLHFLGMLIGVPHKDREKCEQNCPYFGYDLQYPSKEVRSEFKMLVDADMASMVAAEVEKIKAECNVTGVSATEIAPGHFADVASWHPDQKEWLGVRDQTWGFMGCGGLTLLIAIAGITFFVLLEGVCDKMLYLLHPETAKRQGRDSERKGAEIS